jgi:hypothetical protein
LLILVIAISLLIVAGGIGFAVEGWTGAGVFPVALIMGGVGLVVAWPVVDVAVTGWRHSEQIGNARTRVSRLPTDELKMISASPRHADFSFAYAVLASRGIDMKPEMSVLLEMLMSPDAPTRGKGMSFLHAFYPEVHLPSGSSSQDGPEVWRERVVAITAAS